MMGIIQGIGSIIAEFNIAQTFHTGKRSPSQAAATIVFATRFISIT